MEVAAERIINIRAHRNPTPVFIAPVLVSINVVYHCKFSILTTATYPAALGYQTSRVEAEDLDGLRFLRVGGQSRDVIVVDAGRKVEGIVAFGADQGS